MKSGKTFSLLFIVFSAVIMASSASAITFDEYMDLSTKDPKTAGYYTGMEFTPKNDYSYVYTQVTNNQDHADTHDTVLLDTTGGSTTEIARVTNMEKTVFNVNLTAGNTYAIVMGSSGAGTQNVKFGTGSNYSTPDEYGRYTVNGGIVSDISGYNNRMGMPYNVRQLSLFNNGDYENTTVEYITEIYDDADLLVDTNASGLDLNDLFKSNNGFETLENGSLNATSNESELVFKDLAISQFTDFTINASVNTQENVTNTSRPTMRINTYNSSDMENKTGSYYYTINDGINSFDVGPLNSHFNDSDVNKTISINAIGPDQVNGSDLQINEVKISGMLEEPVFSAGGVFAEDNVNVLGMSIEKSFMAVILLLVAFLGALIL